jgi:thioredoxin-like negative regulator of GroEL
MSLSKYIDAVRTLISENKFSEAIDILKTIHSAVPHEPAILIQLGICSSNIRDHESTVRFLMRVAPQEQTTASVLKLIHALRMLGRQAEIETVC